MDEFIKSGRRVLLLIATLLYVPLAPALAVPPGMSPADYNAMEQALVGRLKVPDAQDYSWRSPSGAIGIISTKGTIRHPRCRTRDCTDVCRRYSFTYSKNGKTATFNGARCQYNNGPWTLNNEDFAFGDRLPFETAAAPTVRSPSPAGSQFSADRDLIVAIQRHLKTLLYYDGAIDGNFGPAATAALSEFLLDYRGNEPVAPSVAILALLQEAANSSLPASDCDFTDSPSFGLCGHF